MSLERAEGEGVEPSRLVVRPGSSRVPSPFGLPFHLAPYKLHKRFNVARLPFRHGVHSERSPRRESNPHAVFGTMPLANVCTLMPLGTVASATSASPPRKP